MPPEFGERELDVMGVLWETGSATVTEVRDRLPADLAYTTVLTILRNLEAKGFVRHEGEGKAHRYFPRVAAARPPAGAPSRSLIDKMFGGDPAMLVSHLVSDHPLSGRRAEAAARRARRAARRPRRKARPPPRNRRVAGGEKGSDDPPVDAPHRRRERVLTLAALGAERALRLWRVQARLRLAGDDDPVARPPAPVARAGVRLDPVAR